MSVESVSAASAASINPEVTTQALILRVLAERRGLIDDELRASALNVQNTNQKIEQINQFTAKVGYGENGADFSLGDISQVDDVSTQEFKTHTLDNGNTFIDLGDGYGVVVEKGREAQQSWQIVEFDPALLEDGTVPSDMTFDSTTRIYGDPHVDEQSDGSTDWDFVEDSTFILPNGVKVSVETAPYKGQDDATVSANLFISKGDHQAVVAGLADNSGGRGHGNDKIDVVADGSLFSDAEKNDGHIFVVNGDGVGDWKELSGDDMTGGEKTAVDALFQEVTTLPMNKENAALFEKLGIDVSQYKQGDVLVLTAEQTAELEAKLDSAFSVEATEANINLLQDLGMNLDGAIFNGKIVLSESEADVVLQSASDLTASLKATSQQDLIELQDVMNKMNELLKQETNTMSTHHGEADSVIGNLRL